MYAVNPSQAARHREAAAVSGKKDVAFDAAALANIARSAKSPAGQVAGEAKWQAAKVAARPSQLVRAGPAARRRARHAAAFPGLLVTIAALTARPASGAAG